MSGSWVTSTMVLPLAWSWSKRAMISIAGLGVEVAGRLVGEDDGGAVDERAGDRHALALTAGELVGLVSHADREANFGSSASLARSMRSAAGVPL